MMMVPVEEIVAPRKEEKDDGGSQNETSTIRQPSETMKGMDANKYATKKTVAQGMLDIALLTSNASQLKYVLQVGEKHEFYTLLVTLISVSIVLQTSAGLLTLAISRMKTGDLSDRLYHLSVALLTAAIFCDVIKMTFGLDPALSERDFLRSRTDL